MQVGLTALGFAAAQPSHISLELSGWEKRIRQEKQCLDHGKQQLLCYSAGHPRTAATRRGALRSNWGQQYHSGEKAGLKQPRFPVQRRVPLSEYTSRLNWSRA